MPPASPRGTGHNEQALYSERPELGEQYEAPCPQIRYGTQNGSSTRRRRQRRCQYRHHLLHTACWPAIEEARHRLSKVGIETATLRLRALPINGDVRAFVERYDRVYVIEMNRDGQMHTILQSEMSDIATK